MKVPRAGQFTVLVFALLFAPHAAAAQGGPPLVTDDPGTPGDRHWEVNVAFISESRGSERTLEAPLIDANYGLGDRIQLKIEVPWLVRSQESGPTQSGLGNALFGVKWRFLDEESSGVSIATYPQFEVHTSGFSAEKGVEENPGLILPLSLSKSLGAVSANIEIGPIVRRGEKPRWIYGLALGHELSERFEILAEIFGLASSDLSSLGPAWNVGARWKLHKHAILMASGGAGIKDLAQQPKTKLQIYAGLQLLF